MSVKWVTALSASAGLLVMVDMHPATAQQAAQATAAGGGGLEEIVVTARRREERVQTVPIAITAFSQADIEQRHVQQLEDLNRAVPSFNINSSQSDPNAAYSANTLIRGLPGAVVYFSDVPLGSTNFNTSGNLFPRGLSPGFYYDLDNVEILKGPQGTLFGKNSIGGLVSIEPKKPTDNFEGYGKATLGNYNDREFEGAINVPIVRDKLLLRVAGQSQVRDGYTKDISNGKDYDNRDYFAWRVGVTFRPTDDLENYFIYDGYWQHTNGSSTIPTYINPAFTFAQIPLPDITKPGQPKFNVPLTLGKAYQGLTLNDLTSTATGTKTYFALLDAHLAGLNPTIAFFPNIAQIIPAQQALGIREVLGRATPGIGKDYFYGFTNTTTWDINDSLTIKNIAAARVFKTLVSNDDFGAPLGVLTVGDPINNHGWSDNSVQYTEELQLQGKAIDDKLHWVLGGYLELDHPLGDGLTPSTGVGSTVYTRWHNTSRSQAAFAHGIYDLSDYVDGLRFTAGYRYTWDYVSVQALSTKNADAIMRDANGVATNCGGFGFDNNCQTDSSAHFSSYGWNLSLDEQLDQDTLLYIRSGNAYRPGGSNPQVPIQYQSLKPEHVTDVEIGAKVDWSLYGMHLRTNGDLFHTDYKAIQVSQLVQVPSPNGGPPTVSTLETNAASAYLEGGELEATIVPIPSVEISPHVSYLYTHYDQYPPVLNGGPGYQPPFNFTPKWMYGVLATYHLPVDQSVGDISVTANYAWKGHQYDDGAIGEIFPIIPSYGLLDLRIDWTDIFGQPLDFGFFMTNALDETYVRGVLPLYTQLGFTSLVYGEPRMFGFSLKYRFSAAAEEEPAPYTPPPAQPPQPAVARSYMVFFDFDKSDLTPDAVKIVDQAAANAAPAKASTITVTGHTDTVGSDAYNMRLGKRRAESVAARLEKDGIPSAEIVLISKGKRDLLVPTKDGVREPQNRRVTIVYDGGAGA
jgi:iron complex outermembrane receptor protein